MVRKDYGQDDEHDDKDEHDRRCRHRKMPHRVCVLPECALSEWQKPVVDNTSPNLPLVSTSRFNQHGKTRSFRACRWTENAEPCQPGASYVHIWSYGEIGAKKGLQR